VTGAGRGIGVAAAAALAEQGAEVILTARTEREIGAVAEAIRNAGGRAQAVTLDVTDAAACNAFFRAQGVFDVLVNNAGMNRPAPLLETSDASIEEVFSLNVLAAYRIARGVAVGLIAAGRGGSIINMSSQMGHVGGPNRTVYCGTKHAIEGMTKALAWELGPQQIRVNTLCPTFIETPMTSPMLDDESFRSRVLGRIALGRIGTVEDVMGGIVFLASSASALVTGSALMIDGGWTAQ
jgi:NAD(P)-dependent dehydrogenase (short-subunit alcohol dehydrogenase family)